MAEKTEITDLLVYGIDMKARRIYFGTPIGEGTEEHSDFTHSSVDMAVRAMHKMADEAPGKQIEIHMSSYGGDTYSSMRLHDEILSCPCQVKFFGGGAIMSAATLIMVACDERYLHPNATVMIHELADAHDYMKNTDIQVNALECTRLMDVLCDLYAKNSRMPKDFWHDVSQRDLYLSAAEAVSLGLADKLVEPKKRGNLRRMRQASLKKDADKTEMRKLVNSIYGRIGKVKIPRLEMNEPVKEPVDPNIVVVKTETPQEQSVPEANQSTTEVKVT